MSKIYQNLLLKSLKEVPLPETKQASSDDLLKDDLGTEAEISSEASGKVCLRIFFPNLEPFL